jgi:hypothetical protein
MTSAEAPVVVDIAQIIENNGLSALLIRLVALSWARSSLSKLANFDRVIGPAPWQLRDETIPGWTGEAKWNYSKRSGVGARPGRRLRT